MKEINYILLYVTAILLFLLPGCGEEEAGGGVYTGQRFMMRANIPYLTSGATATDDRISTLRVIVFNRVKELVSNRLVDVNVTADGVSFNMEVAKGLNDFYVICNETEALKTQLTELKKEEDLDKITFEAAGIAPPLPMYGKVTGAFVTANGEGEDIKVTVDGSTASSLTIGMDRLLAKLNITVIKNITDKNADFTVNELRVQVCRMPKYSTLKAGEPYTKDEWAANRLYKGEGALTVEGEFSTDGAYTISPENAGKITFPDIYLPEHLLSKPEDEAEATFLLVDMAYQMKTGNTTQRNTTYIVPIGQAPPVNHNITRNHHYKVYATIRGLGAMGIYAEIAPFTEYHHPVEWVPFEGYAIVSEKLSESGKDINVWNDYSEYSGILKIRKGETVSPALFRYGSLIALAEGTTSAPFASTDVLSSGPAAAIPATWGAVGYQSLGSITHDELSLPAGKGDPCRLVGLTAEEIGLGTMDNGLWRMPTDIEMEWLNTARNDNAMPGGFYSFMSLLTPKSGYRDEQGTMMPATAITGRYWSATGTVFSFSDNVKQEQAADARCAYAVRCIRTDAYRHKSRFSISGAVISPDGQTNMKALIREDFLVPFWKIVPDPANPLGITFNPPLQGNGSISPEFSVEKLPDPYVGRIFKATVFAYGLDGEVVEDVIVIKQDSLVHTVALIYESSADLVFDGTYYRIPKEGTTLTVKMAIVPNPLPPYTAGFENLQWKAAAKRYTNQWTTLTSSTATTKGVSTVEISPNEWGHTVAVDVSFVWMSPLDSPPTLRPTIKFIQEK